MPTEILPILDEELPPKSGSEDATASSRKPSPGHALPPGIILDKDGKPCRSCNSGQQFRAWAAMTKKKAGGVDGATPADSSPSASASATTTTTTATPSASLPDDCPADVETLGRSTWTLLHTIAARYPEAAVPAQQAEMKTFMSIFSRIYPCWACAEDFQAWMSRPENKLDRFLGSRDMFGMWMCMAHNDVNKKLGKDEFDCRRWKERWRDGWKDGRCD